MKAFRAGVLGWSLVFVSCAGVGGDRPSSHPTPTDKAEWQRATLGKTADEAMTLCRKWGLQAVRQRGDFVESLDRSQVLYRNLDYLYVDREGAGGLVSRRTQVALVLETNRITRVLFSSGLTGP